MPSETYNVMRVQKRKQNILSKGERYWYHLGNKGGDMDRDVNIVKDMGIVRVPERVPDIIRDPLYIALGF